MNADSLQKAVDLAMANEVRIPRDLRLAISNSFEPDNTIVGPTKDRGGPAGRGDTYIVEINCLLKPKDN